MEEDAMTFADYEARARFEENYAPDGIDIRYGALALAGEAGELANVVKKAWWSQGNTRDDDVGLAPLELDADTTSRIADEAGDVLWYLAAICDACGVTLEDIARLNIAKVQTRYGVAVEPLSPRLADMEERLDGVNGLAASARAHMPRSPDRDATRDK